MLPQKAFLLRRVDRPCQIRYCRAQLAFASGEAQPRVICFSTGSQNWGYAAAQRARCWKLLRDQPGMTASFCALLLAAFQASPNCSLADFRFRNNGEQALPAVTASLDLDQFQRAAPWLDESQNAVSEECYPSSIYNQR